MNNLYIVPITAYNPVVHHELENLKAFEVASKSVISNSNSIDGEAYKSLNKTLGSKLSRMIILSELIMISATETNEMENGLLRYANQFGKCWTCADCISSECLRGFGLEAFYENILTTEKAKMIVMNCFAEAYAEVEHPKLKAIFKNYFGEARSNAL